MQTHRMCLVFVAILVLAARSEAHKFKCFATAEGKIASGYAWVGGGGRPKGVAFKVTAPDGATLHQGKTNEKGEFSFPVRFKCDHTIVVDGGEGHRATYVLRADELPDGLTRFGAGKAVSVAKAGTSPPRPSGVAATPGNSATPLASARDLKRVVASAVHKQVAPLRRDLAEFKERQRVQDIIGGIGYLLGVAGIAFYFLGVRRKERRSAAP